MCLRTRLSWSNAEQVNGTLNANLTMGRSGSGLFNLSEKLASFSNPMGVQVWKVRRGDVYKISEGVKFYAEVEKAVGLLNIVGLTLPYLPKKDFVIEAFSHNGKVKVSIKTDFDVRVFSSYFNREVLFDTDKSELNSIKLFFKGGVLMLESEHQVARNSPVFDSVDWDRKVSLPVV